MTTDILAAIHLLLNVIAICVGGAVLYGLLAGRLLRVCCSRFLQVSLFASVTGLSFSVHHLLLTEKISMLSVYVAGAAILAWRKYHLSGIWSSVFAAAITIVLYLNVLLIVDRKLGYGSSQTSPDHLTAPLAAAQLLVALLFVALGTSAIRRFHFPSIGSTKTTRIFLAR